MRARQLWHGLRPSYCIRRKCRICASLANRADRLKCRLVLSMQPCCIGPVYWGFHRKSAPPVFRCPCHVMDAQGKTVTKIVNQFFSPGRHDFAMFAKERTLCRRVSSYSTSHPCCNRIFPLCRSREMHGIFSQGFAIFQKPYSPHPVHFRKI